MSDGDEKIKSFCLITGAGAETAQRLLAACNENLEMAINMHMEGVDVPAENATSSSASGNGASSAPRVPDPHGEEEVRAPIPQRQERMIEAGYEGYHLQRENTRRKARVRSVFDGFRNFGAEANGSGPSAGAGATSASKKRTLEELFKPPLDITYKGDFQAAKDAASVAKKWLLVNIQDAGEFQCQVLNRDVWSSEAVKTVVREHFLLWQQYKECDEAQRFLTFYPAAEWPYIVVLDPRTGEKLVSWSKVDATSFCDLVAEFLHIHKDFLDKGSAPSSAKKVKPNEDDGDEPAIIDADEDEQLAAAIKASLAESAKETAEAPKGSGDSSDLEFSEDDEEEEQAKPAAATVDEVKDKVIDTVPVPKELLKLDDWQKHLGDESDPKSTIMIRFPDGNRESKVIPCSSSLMAIIQYVASKGFPMESYEIVANFPRRIITKLDDTRTLKEHGLFPQETVFVQKI